MELDDVSRLLTGLALLAIVAYSILRVLWQKQRVATLTLPNGHTYTYLIGDYLPLYGAAGAFHGVDISLPKELPHIYLDSLRGGGRRQRFVIDPSQRLQLEGNFNQTYRVYVPKKYEVLALSLLSPDVMATLQDHASQFDVEIYGSHVRIASNKRVMSRPELQRAIEAVGLRVMQEVDHRLASWSNADSLDAVHQQLLLYPASGFRLFGRSITFRSLWITLYWLLVTAGLGVIGIFTLTYPEFRVYGYGLLGFFGLLWIGFVIFGHRASKHTRFGSRQ